jgi:arylsulfatase
MTSQTKPNIVVIWAPDIEASELGCYSRRRSCTPNIDSLARDGMLFFNTALEPGGTPAVEFMSGQSTAPGTLARSGGAPSGRRRDVTLAAALRARGYATGQFGGLRPDVLEDCLVCLDSFDEIAGWPRGAGAVAAEGHDAERGAPPELRWWARFGQRKAPAEPLPSDPSEPSDEELVALALRFMRRQHMLGTPFFAWIRATHTHSVERRANGVRSQRASRIAAHDRNVGEVLEQLEQLGLADDTFVIYSVEDPSCQNLGDAGQLTSPSEPGENMGVGPCRPLLVRWPGRVAAGSACNGVVHFRDWLPTLLAVAGGPRLRERFTASAGPALRASEASVLGSNVLPFLVGDAPARAPSGLTYFDDDGGLLTFRYDNWEVRRRDGAAPPLRRSPPPRSRRASPPTDIQGGPPSPGPAARVATRRRVNRGAHHRAGER